MGGVGLMDTMEPNVIDMTERRAGQLRRDEPQTVVDVFARLMDPTTTAKRILEADLQNPEDSANL